MQNRMSPDFIPKGGFPMILPNCRTLVQIILLIFLCSHGLYAQAEVSLTSILTFTWNNGPQGWTATNDFRLDSAFTKLSGPVDGLAWVTESPANPDRYTEGAVADREGYPHRYPGPNLLVSPLIDLTQMHDTVLYLSFQQSISVEPGWDGSWMEYSAGTSGWKHLGRLNDPDGVNWYATALYRNASSGTGNPPDTATMIMNDYRLYGPGTGNPVLPIAWWTSNGDPLDGMHPLVGATGTPEGPSGWVACRLRITKSGYPDIFAASSVRFRYVAFADAANAYEGWAVDNFTIGTTEKK